MTQYIFRRLLQAVPLLFLISLILFLLMYSSGDPIATLGGRDVLRAEDQERLRRLWGLDQPLLTQYLYWLIGNEHVMIDVDGDGEGDQPGTRLGVLRGDFGDSIIARGRPAITVIADRIPNTLLLTLTAEVLIIAFSLFIGIFSALRQYSTADNIITTLSFIFFSMPVFWLGLMLLYLFAVRAKAAGLPYFPTGGMYDPAVGPTIAQVAWHLVLPSVTIALISIAGYNRYIRSSMLEVISADYMRTARSKGLSEQRILFVHALRNASLPIVTLIGLDLPFLLAGAVVTEQIFAWPGMGRLFVDALARSDFTVLMGLLMMISVAVVIFQLLTDILYTVLDPRIRY